VHYYNNSWWRAYYTIHCFIKFGNIVAIIFLYVPMWKVIHDKYRKCKESRLMNYPADLSSDEGKNMVTNTFASKENRSRCEGQHKAWKNAKHRFTIMLFIITIIYAITKFTTLIFVYVYFESASFWRYNLDSDTEMFNMFLSLRRIHLINNIVNPFLYGYFDLTC
jgi:hypothetical protein